MIDQQTYKKNLTLLESLKTKKSKIEGNIETRNTQIDKINKDIEDLKIKAKELEPLSKDANKFMDQVLERKNLEEGKKKAGTKLCSRGKSAAKAKFDVYPSAYANGYAVSVCKGRIKGLDGKKRCSPPYC